MSWPDILYSIVLRCLLALFPAIVRISVRSTEMNPRITAVLVVVRVGGANVAAAHESQRNRNITAWFSSFKLAWFFTGFNRVKILSKRLVTCTYQRTVTLILYSSFLYISGRLFFYVSGQNFVRGLSSETPH